MNKRYDILEPTKNKKSYCKCIFYKIVAVLICLSSCLLGIIIRDKYTINNTYGKDHLLKNMTSFRRQLRYYHHRKTCDDYKWGCCEIYHDCTIVNDSIIDYKIIPLETYPKEDENGTNCPRVYNLINNHNRHYPVATDCHSSEYDCCELNYVCDLNVNEWFGKYNYMNNNILKDLVESRINGCPTYKTLSYEYLAKYPQDTDDATFVLWFFGILALSIMYYMGEN